MNLGINQFHLPEADEPQAAAQPRPAPLRLSCTWMSIAAS